ncbi:ras and Rab interactor 3-like [Brienomyrus brachyistius]|uniref:ras and Rab interactor 3-like n=1 Tax=Brienomyrus brachyistius TaxID=42636 RepID=UPI0020B40854|nr:ras and Rab interactor 3-like [Brienomyrus brachyistius]
MATAMMRTAGVTQETRVSLDSRPPNSGSAVPASPCEASSSPSAFLKTTSNRALGPVPLLDLQPSLASCPGPLSLKNHRPTSHGGPTSPSIPATPSSPQDRTSSPPQDFVSQSPPTPMQLSVPSVPLNISVLERLIKTCPVWLQLGMAPERATLILQKEVPGVFLVRKNPCLKKMVLSVRLSDQEGVPQVQDLLIKDQKSLIYVDGSVLVFDDIFKLIAFYCVSRDILPFKLKLPQAIALATKYEEMEMISSLGSEFWGSALNRCPEVGKVCPRSRGSTHGHASQCSCELQPSVGDDRLWYVNPIFIEEYCSSPSHTPPISRSQSLTTPGQGPPRYKRPPPLPPRPQFSEESASAKLARGRASWPASSAALRHITNPPLYTPRGRAVGESPSVPAQLPPPPPPPCSSSIPAAALPPAQQCIPSVPPRRRNLEKQPEEPPVQEEEQGAMPSDGGETVCSVPVATLVCIDDAPGSETGPADEGVPRATTLPTKPPDPVAPAVAPIKKQTPVPPPRKKRQSHVTFPPAIPTIGEESQEEQLDTVVQEAPSQTITIPTPTHCSISNIDLQGSDVSLYSPEGGVTQLDHDSYSTSSTEEEADVTGSPVIPVKKSPTVMLDKAKQRLSMANLSHIFISFMSADRKLKKRIVELAQDRETYFGNLVRDYRAFTLETMEQHSSSTEMLQEIRLMMTQLKNYLIQSAELKAILEPVVHPEEKLEVIIEAALCKSVLKPLREAVYSRLRDLHTQDGSLDRLREHQKVVLGTTTTDLGITTSVPETPAMEKIQVKLGSLHKEYSPEKKISLLLKACKIIYESMSVSSPGKAHGADDFLPVLMYVLVRCNMTTLLLDVEYMMELMDPALQLGEGSYYLTTTYGALEHIKNYDKLEVTGQLSLEIQDSIHRWERRRTLNKARGSRTSVQDFINVSFLEAGSNTKTLGAHENTTALELCAQCAKKFDVLEPESYGLFVLVDGHYRPLAPDELPLSVKSSLHHSEPRKDYYFVYRPGGVAKDPTPLQTPTPPDSLI